MNELTKKQQDAKDFFERIVAIEEALNEAEIICSECINYPDCSNCDGECEKFSNNN
jgi:hypothetical protein